MQTQERLLMMITGKMVSTADQDSLFPSKMELTMWQNAPQQTTLGL